jgi:thymidylate kinase
MKHQPYFVCFTGAQGTGKSTTLEGVGIALRGHFNDIRIGLINDAVRRLVRDEHIRNNREAGDVDQMLIIMTYLAAWRRMLDEGYDLIMSDRSLVCMVAYTLTNPHTQGSVRRAAERCLVYQPDTLFYFPIQPEIPLVADMARDPDPAYQQSVDQAIQSLLAKNNLPFVSLGNRVQREERCTFIAEYILHRYFPQIAMQGVK